MPKDLSTPLPQAAEGVPSRRPGQKPGALGRNQSCRECRKKKIRCDAIRPACGKCVRTFNSQLQSLNPSQPRPTQPTCTYEDAPTSSSLPNEPSSSTSSREASSSAPVAGAGLSSHSTSTADPNALELRVRQLEDMLKMAVAGGGGGSSDASGKLAAALNEGRNQQHPREGSGGVASTSSSGSAMGFSSTSFVAAGETQFQMGLSTRALPPPGQFFASEGSNTLPPLTSTSSQPNSSAYFPPPLPPQPHLHRQTLTHPGRVPFPHPYLTSRTPNQPPPPPPVPTWPFGASSSSSHQSHSYSTSPSSFVNEPNPMAPSPSTLSGPTSTQDSTFLSPSEEGRSRDDVLRKLSGVESLASLGDSSRVGDDAGFSGLEGILNQLEEAPSVPVGVDDGILDSDSAQFLRDLLWPGWPAHLPCPTKLEHIVETFFTFVPWSTHVLNKERFLARLALPPRNSGFPHPALLHAICAVTARFIGGLDLLPLQFSVHPLDGGVPTGERNDLEDVLKPKWDGFGPRPAVGTTTGVDQDFGQIHFTWGRLYAQQACNKTQCGIETTQALYFLSLYASQVGMWPNAFGIASMMTRMALICGLNARPFVDRRTIKKPSMVPPPKDDIERIERQNLFWMVLSVDTFSCGGSGWEGTLSVSDAWIGIPTSKATFFSQLTPPLPSQFPDSDDLFTHHPPEHSSPFAITIKGTILLRRCADYVRRSDLGGKLFPRETSEFIELDNAISQLRDSSPSSVSSPSASSTSLVGGLSIDRDAVLAHALPFVAQLVLHQRYWDGSDPIDPSLPKLREGIRGLLDQVHVLSRTSFDFGLLQPFLVVCWYLGSRTLLSMLEVVLEDQNMSAVPSILQNIETFRLAMLRVGERLPFGYRQGTLVNTLLVDVLRPSSTVY